MRSRDEDGKRHDLILREFARQAGTFEDPRLNGAFTRHLQRLVDFARPDPEDVCLDVACGTGLVARALAVRTRHVIALDTTPQMWATGKAQADAEGVSTVVFQRGDAARLVERADVFDVERPLDPWLEQAGTPGDVARQTENELSREISGGTPTGMRPLVMDGEPWFTQTWAHISVTVP